MFAIRPNGGALARPVVLRVWFAYSILLGAIMTLELNNKW